MKKFVGLMCILLFLLPAGCAKTPVETGATPSAVRGASPSVPEKTGVEAPHTPEPERTFLPGQAERMTLTLIGVGDADCFLLTLPDGGAILIDTGRKADYDTIASTLKARGVTSLRALVLTHGHKDHVGGAEALLEEYPAERILISKVDDVTFSKKIKALLQDREEDVVRLSVGETLAFGPVQIEVLAPLHADRKNENNNSLVLRAVYGDTAFLLMGDAEQEVERELLSRGTNLRADVLKVAHHGEDDATGILFLRAVAPKFAAITGDDTKDPQTLSPVVLDRLRQENVEFYSSKEFAIVDFASDGAEVTVTSVAR